MTTARDFIDFWMENSIHPDEPLAVRRGRVAIQNLADRCVAAANEQGFSEDQIKSEIGDVYEHFRQIIDGLNERQNKRQG